jgi:hypothetical protein
MNQEWKTYREMYNRVMANRHTDIIEDTELVVEDNVNVPAAMKYLQEQSFPLIQPSKSRVVAIVYAKLLSIMYDGDFYKVLDDPELLTDDCHFVPYSQDKEGYDLLLANLPNVNKWETMGGWVLRTMKYFWMECTWTGCDFAMTASDEEMQSFLEHGDIRATLQNVV